MKKLIICSDGTWDGPTGLADLALNWMIDQTKQAGLAFDDGYLAQITAPDPCGKLHRSRRGI